VQKDLIGSPEIDEGRDVPLRNHHDGHWPEWAPVAKGKDFVRLRYDVDRRPATERLIEIEVFARTHVMTRARDAVVAKLATLSPEEQDRIAIWRIEELHDDEHWARPLANSQDALSKLAAEVRADRAAGEATELDPDNL
jgi:hypothetical protein